MTDIIKTIIDRVSSYQFFNFIYPGLLVAGILDIYSVVNIFDLNIWYIMLICYFLGMMSSRIGSLVIEEILVKCKGLERFEYEDFNEAEKNNSKVTLHLELSNMYRTLTAVCFEIFVAKIVSCFYDFGFAMPKDVTIGIILLFVIFGFSFVKQYGYLKKCIAANQE